MREHFKIQFDRWNKNPRPLGKLYFMFAKEDGTKEILAVRAFAVENLSRNYKFTRMVTEAIPEFKYKENTCY